MTSSWNLNNNIVALTFFFEESSKYIRLLIDVLISYVNFKEVKKSNTYCLNIHDLKYLLIWKHINCLKNINVKESTMCRHDWYERKTHHRQQFMVMKCYVHRTYNIKVNSILYIRSNLRWYICLKKELQTRKHLKPSKIFPWCAQLLDFILFLCNFAVFYNVIFVYSLWTKCKLCEHAFLIQCCNLKEIKYMSNHQLIRNTTNILLISNNQ